MEPTNYHDPATLTADDLDGYEQMGLALRAHLDAQATEMARLFREEFPGQELSGDWDSQAWESVSQDLRGDLEMAHDRACEAAGHDLGWAYFAEALRAALDLAHDAAAELVEVAP